VNSREFACNSSFFSIPFYSRQFQAKNVNPEVNMASISFSLWKGKVYPVIRHKRQRSTKGLPIELKKRLE